MSGPEAQGKKQRSESPMHALPAADRVHEREEFGPIRDAEPRKPEVV